jgi:hypothetical protein
MSGSFFTNDRSRIPGAPRPGIAIATKEIRVRS